MTYRYNDLLINTIPFAGASPSPRVDPLLPGALPTFARSESLSKLLSQVQTEGNVKGTEIVSRIKTSYYLHNEWIN